jgi:DNA invertase Pin-like site-specific DNA recombinase
LAPCATIARFRISAADRAQLRRLLDQLEADDVLMVTRLDRLAIHPRPVEHPRHYHRQEGRFQIPWRHVGRHHDIARAAHAAGACVAEFERDLIRARTGEGRARAVERGQKMGRPFKLTDHQKGEAIKRRNEGETLADIARTYNVSPATISRLA